MSTVTEHYSRLLAPIYLWMAGGFEHAIALGANDIAAFTSTGGTAVDLGAGFGMHAVPLAKAGYDVLAIDSSAVLLATLRDKANGLRVRTREMDLLAFRAAMDQPADLILCMGDTLTHLDTEDTVARLAREVGSALRAGGRFVATFRDYSHPPTGDARFIPVRGDADRILTCFLEEADRHVIVHDLLHEREGESWTTRVSSYRKLRLAPSRAVEIFEDAGLRATVESGPRGMVQLVAGASALGA